MEVIQTLSSNVDNENLDFRKASIITLGYICEEVNMNSIGRENRDLIFSAIVQTIENNIRDPKIVEVGVKALY